MAGMNVEAQPRGGRRPLDSEINLIPMIDLLVCCIAFLLITAVWSHMGRVEARADVAGQGSGPQVTLVPDKTLHVLVKDQGTFTLLWRQGQTVISSVDVVRQPVMIELNGMRQIRYPDLATRIQTEWQASGSHRDSADPKRDLAVLHAPNAERFGELVAVMDAVHSARRVATHDPAFTVSFAAD
jgi:biopolymer transport protein ExbD